MSSNSDSEDDEIRARLLASVDLNIYNDSMYKEKPANEEKKVPKTEKLKSNRYIENTEEVFQSDLNVTEATKKYVCQKLSKMIEAEYEFVELSSLNASKHKTHNKEYIQLLTNAPMIDLNKDPNPDIIQFPNKNFKIKKRLIDPESEPTEKNKILEAHIPTDLIHGKSTIKFWRSRRKSTIYEYRTKNKVAFYQEPKTEWTDLRKRNNWSEEKIRQGRKNKHVVGKNSQ